MSFKPSFREFLVYYRLRVVNSNAGFLGYYGPLVRLRSATRAPLNGAEVARHGAGGQLRASRFQGFALGQTLGSMSL